MLLVELSHPERPEGDTVTTGKGSAGKYLALGYEVIREWDTAPPSAVEDDSAGEAAANDKDS